MQMGVFFFFFLKVCQLLGEMRAYLEGANPPPHTVSIGMSLMATSKTEEVTLHTNADLILFQMINRGQETT